MRIALKQANNLLKGYSPAFASHALAHQSSDPDALYLYRWQESITPIPDRGNPEIRANRIANLRLAASRIDRLNLDPCQIFSFCHCVGDPLPRHGFKEGPVFAGGRVVTGSGGGLCLVATNLFHLGLHGGCQILERHCHSIDAYGDDRFYQLGQDASIAYGYKDLMIRNNSGIQLQIRLQVLPEQGVVVSSLWGTAPQPWQSKVTTTVLEELPSTDPEGVSGWIVATQRFRNQPKSRSGSSPWVAKPPQWRLDYRSISTYSPTTPSSQRGVAQVAAPRPGDPNPLWRGREHPPQDTRPPHP